MSLRGQLEQQEKVKKRIDLEDNTLALNLFGKSGENIKRFEKRLGVELNTRGNVVSLPSRVHPKRSF
jgi:phosphate starvation-inducible protein PhoH